LLALAGGCEDEEKPKHPDYDAIRLELAKELATIDGWSAGELEFTPDHLQSYRRGRITNVVWRGFTSPVTKEEVRVALVGGHRRDHPRFCPSSGICTQGLRKFSSAAVASDVGNTYRFSSCLQSRRIRSHLLWAHTLDGGWTQLAGRAAMGSSPQNTYGFTIVFEVIPPASTATDGMSANATRLVARVMDRVSPVLFAHQAISADTPATD
jgi:hypothetical protein